MNSPDKPKNALQAHHDEDEAEIEASAAPLLDHLTELRSRLIVSLAAFAIAFRMLAEGLLPIAQHWQMMLMVLAVGSLVIGNLVAIAQTNFKRMIAYSTIAQIGFVLLGLLSGVDDAGADGATAAYGASMFYVITYVLTTLGTLGVILLLARKGFECQDIDDLRGLNQRSPWMAFVMPPSSSTSNTCVHARWANSCVSRST